MKTPTTRRLIALGLGAALLLTGCASSEEDTTSTEDTQAQAVDPDPNAEPSAADIAALEAVTVEGDPGQAPTLTFDAPFTVGAQVVRHIDSGDGDPVEDGDTVGLHMVAYSGADAQPIEGSDNFGGEPEEAVMAPGVLPPPLVDALSGQNVGARFLFANPFAGDGEGVILAIEIASTRETPKPLDGPEGETVEPAAGLPTVTLDDTGKPSIEVPADYTTDELVVQPLIKGEGAVVKETDEITANYTGWKLDGEQFDSSWDRGEPTSFPLQGVIPGWTQGLAGQTVGSQVLLVIPAELGYGGTEHELAEDTLVFVVDILAIS